jgi:cytochrome c553
MGVREMRKSKLALLCGVFGVLVAGAGYAAEGNAENGKTIFTNGKGAAAACMTCHGDKAQGNDDMTAPRLAGQPTAYIVKQLTDFADDKRTPAGVGAVMPAFAKELNDQDRRDIAAFVNSQPFDLKADGSDLKALKSGGQTVGEAYKGQTIVKFGVKDKLPACQSCHGYNGRGAAPMFPKIGQQRFVYLVNQLHNWRDGSRTNDPMGMMRAVAKGMTDEDIINAATFLTAAPETTQGNHRVPPQE